MSITGFSLMHPSPSIHHLLNVLAFEIFQFSYKLNDSHLHKCPLAQKRLQVFIQYCSFNAQCLGLVCVLLMYNLPFGFKLCAPCPQFSLIFLHSFAVCRLGIEWYGYFRAVDTVFFSSAFTDARYGLPIFLSRYLEPIQLLLPQLTS